MSETSLAKNFRWRAIHVGNRGDDNLRLHRADRAGAPLVEFYLLAPR